MWVSGLDVMTCHEGAFGKWQVVAVVVAAVVVAAVAAAAGGMQYR
jgi:hypothetical protein